MCISIPCKGSVKECLDLKQIILQLQSNSVITNSSGTDILVRYDQVNLCTNMAKFALKSVRYNRVFVLTEFVITEFHCKFNPAFA